MADYEVTARQTVDEAERRRRLSICYGLLLALGTEGTADAAETARQDTTSTGRCTEILQAETREAIPDE